jgi:hypothetical protein
MDFLINVGVVLCCLVIIVVFLFMLADDVLKTVARMHKNVRIIKNEVVTWHGREYRRSK